MQKPRSSNLNVVFYLYFAVKAVPSNSIPSQSIQHELYEYFDDLLHQVSAKTEA